MRLPHEHLISQNLSAPLMRSINGIGLLNLIREHGPVSRASLAKLSNLSKPTVSSQVETLMQRGWVVELGRGESGAKGGKKPTMLTFNANAGRLFAVEIGAWHVRLAAADLEGNILARLAIAIGSDRQAANVLSLAKYGLEQLMAGNPCSADQRVISVAAPGRVDVVRGIVLQAGNVFNWQNVAIREELESAFGTTVIVDNDVRMAALGEVQFGAARGEQDVVLVKLETGLGAAVICRGQLMLGSHWAAGEVAHMLLDHANTDTDWSVRGYLESIVGADRILAAAQEAGSSAQTALEFLLTARHKTGPERVLFDYLSNHLGIAIANLIVVNDPAMVVLQSTLLGALEQELRAIVERLVPWETRIEISTIGDEAVLLGTIVAARRQAYEHIARLFENGGQQPLDSGIPVLAER
ncbi:ROK family transcriptional regulator [Paludibaculum fermentans]|uniref:ROK family transcriptional regulator n=1 Tax=Paludibaculum fermentans TaxID=1473598 RepID=UPI003EBAC415